MAKLTINATGWSFEVVETLGSGRVSRVAEFGDESEAEAYIARRAPATEECSECNAPVTTVHGEKTGCCLGDIIAAEVPAEVTEAVGAVLAQVEDLEPAAARRALELALEGLVS